MTKKINIPKLDKNKPSCFFCFEQNPCNNFVLFPEINYKFQSCDKCFKYSKTEKGYAELYKIAMDYIITLPELEVKILLGETQFKSFKDYLEKNPKDYEEE